MSRPTSNNCYVAYIWMVGLPMAIFSGFCENSPQKINIAHEQNFEVALLGIQA